jgi:hypothetical protein
MAYTILNSDGTTLLLLTDNDVDQSTTSLSLVGKNVSGYGQYLNNNFISLLENFANSSNNPPRSPVTGQLWYDTTSGKLNIYDGGFKSVSGAIVSSLQPNILSSGDMWWDTTNNQLKISNLDRLYTVGPAFPQGIGSTGWVLPEETLISSTSSVSQDVLFLENYGQLVGALSNDTFDLTVSDSLTYLKSSTTATLVRGLNVFGNIQHSGQINNNYLSASVDLTRLLELSGGEQSGMSDPAAYNKQNISICNLLTTMFPVAASTSTNEVGVPLGSNARVIVNFPDAATPSGSNTNRMQVRRFTVVNKSGVGVCWQPTEIYVNTSTANTVVTGLAKVNIMPYTG